jgi:hypothetical protein
VRCGRARNTRGAAVSQTDTRISHCAVAAAPARRARRSRCAAPRRCAPPRRRPVASRRASGVSANARGGPQAATVLAACPSGARARPRLRRRLILLRHRQRAALDGLRACGAASAACTHPLKLAASCRHPRLPQGRHCRRRRESLASQRSAARLRRRRGEREGGRARRRGPQAQRASAGALWQPPTHSAELSSDIANDDSVPFMAAARRPRRRDGEMAGRPGHLRKRQHPRAF